MSCDSRVIGRDSAGGTAGGAAVRFLGEDLLATDFDAGEEGRKRINTSLLLDLTNTPLTCGKSVWKTREPDEATNSTFL